MEDSDDELFCRALDSFEHPGGVQQFRAAAQSVGAVKQPLQALNGALPAAPAQAPAAACGTDVRRLFSAAPRHAAAPQQSGGIAHEAQQRRQPSTAPQQSCCPNHQHLGQQAARQEQLPCIPTEGQAAPRARSCGSWGADGAAGSRAGPPAQRAASTPAAAGQRAAEGAAQPPRQGAAADAAAAPTTGDEAGGRAAAPAAAAVEAPAQKRRLRQLFDFLLVLDLEATCDRDKATQPRPQEVIELSCVVVDTSTLRLLPASFQRYVRPDQHPRLTEFCTELTGITQAMVDGGVPLRVALTDLQAWLREQGLLGQGKTFVPVTWRDWDLKVQMAMECRWRGIPLPRFFQRWVDVSAAWQKHSGKKGNLRASVEAAGLAWDGRAHSAIDDARNTARLAIKLMSSGVILGVTGSFTGVDASGRFKQATLFGGTAGVASGGGGGGSAGAGLGAPPPRKKHRVFEEGGAWNGGCYCGVKAKKRQVKKPGPNNGRWFWSCGKFSMTGGGAQCDFMKFEDQVVEPPGMAAGSGGGTGGAKRGWGGRRR